MSSSKKPLASIARLLESGILTGIFSGRTWPKHQSQPLRRRPCDDALSTVHTSNQLRPPPPRLLCVHPLGPPTAPGARRADAVGQRSDGKGAAREGFPRMDERPRCVPVGRLGFVQQARSGGGASTCARGGEAIVWRREFWCLCRVGGGEVACVRVWLVVWVSGQRDSIKILISSFAARCLESVLFLSGSFVPVVAGFSYDESTAVSSSPLTQALSVKTTSRKHKCKAP